MVNSTVFFTVRHSTIALAAVIVLMCCAPARADLLPEVQRALYAGQTEAAIAAAQSRLAEAPTDDQARFALGAAQFLRAVERLGQGLYRYGLQSEYRNSGGLPALPILRLPIPENPHPEPITYSAFRAILADFVADLNAADDTLAKIGDSDIAMPLNIGLIRLDLRADGAAAADETLWTLFARVNGYPLTALKAGVSAENLQTDFDAADVPWLRGYCNLLMAIVDIPLAYDWSETFEWTFQDVFAEGPFAAGELRNVDRDARDELARLNKSPPYFIWDPNLSPSKNREEAEREWRNSTEGQAYNRWSKLKNHEWFAQIADLVAALHTTHWPVVEPARLTSALGHLEMMVAQSRENWRRILLDTNPGKR